MNASWRWGVLVALILICSGHVGSPDVWYDGPAGPYSVRVLVKPPIVVPGLAEIVVRVRGGATTVSVAPAHSDTGDEGQPPPDQALPIDAGNELFGAQLWLMARGAYRLIVDIEGPRGPGRVILPVTAMATERRPMTQARGIGLLAALAFLFVGLVSIVGAAVRESVLPVGERVLPERVSGARRAMVVASLVAVLILLGGWRWWSAVDEFHRSRLDRPWATQTTIRSNPDGSATLSLAITDSIWRARGTEGWQRNPRDPWGTLVSDHGKLMHLFLMREDQGAFAHLHPVTGDTTRFDVTLPDLPAGRYAVYADIVEGSGATRTLVDSVTLASDALSGPMSPMADPDDASWSGPPGGNLSGEGYSLGEGLSMRIGAPTRVMAGEGLELTAEVFEANGSHAALEPYMGMAAHAVVEREDGAVFVHLHPLGTISVAAQQAVATEGSGVRSQDAGRDADHTDRPAHADIVSSRIAFPYAFPKPGRYRVWVQVKQGGRVLTGARDIEVIDGIS